MAITATDELILSDLPFKWNCIMSPNSKISCGVATVRYRSIAFLLCILCVSCGGLWVSRKGSAEREEKRAFFKQQQHGSRYCSSNIQAACSNMYDGLVVIRFFVCTGIIHHHDHDNSSCNINYYCIYYHPLLSCRYPYPTTLHHLRLPSDATTTMAAAAAVVTGHTRTLTPS